MNAASPETARTSVHPHVRVAHDFRPLRHLDADELREHLTLSDIVSEKPVPAGLKDDLDAWSACIAGALEKSDYLCKMGDAAFGKVEVTAERDFYVETVEDGKQHKFLSIIVKAHKPRVRRAQPARRGVAA